MEAGNLLLKGVNTVIFINPPKDVNHAIWMSLNKMISEITDAGTQAEFISGICESTMNNLIFADNATDNEIVNAAITDEDTDIKLSAGEIRDQMKENALTIIRWLRTYHFISAE